MGYSPERINPGDKEHTVTNIVKVVSGSDAQALEEVAGVYSIIVKAGVFRAENIKTAEAAKVIENTQRDLNIALMNELSLIFRMIGVDTQAVLKAAGTKWNFIKMQPGLVGGHCIGVDPYYLTYKAEELGYHPEVILAGRRINDNMGKYVAEQTVKQLIAAGRTIKGSKVMMAGITFKENVSDIRNSKVVDIVNELHEYGIKVIICDPLADKNEVKREYGLLLTKYSPSIRVDGIVFAVNHAEYMRQFTPEVIKGHFARKSTPVVIDLKGMFGKKEIAKLKALYWRL
jgi:UDP-N-acetyl-D-galactosamine dehydrogenase